MLIVLSVSTPSDKVSSCSENLFSTSLFVIHNQHVDTIVTYTFIYATSTVAYATLLPLASLVNNGPILFGEARGEGQFSMGLGHEASGKPLEKVRQISLVLK